MTEKQGTPVDSNEFDRIWQMFTEIGEFERHFNDLGSRYRSLASTWLLATFAASDLLLLSPPLNYPLKDYLW